MSQGCWLSIAVSYDGSLQMVHRGCIGVLLGFYWGYIVIASATGHIASVCAVLRLSELGLLNHESARVELHFIPGLWTQDATKSNEVNKGKRDALSAPGVRKC